MQLLADEMISYKIIDQLLSTVESTAHLKDIATQKYVFSNIENLKVYGFNSPSQIVGHTAQDLDSFMRPFWGNTFVDEVEQLELLAKTKQQVVKDNNRIFLTFDGKVRVQNMVKYPVVNKNNTVSGILTFSTDNVKNLNLFDLYNIYKSCYSNSPKNVAIKMFLEHIGIKKYFEVLPTEAELLVLIAKRVFLQNKMVGKILGRSKKTIDIHVSNLKNKTSKDISMLVAEMGL